MTLTLSTTSDYNVTATLNADFETFLATIVFPSWFGSVPEIQMISDKFEPSVPVYSMNHIGVSMDFMFQGNVGSAANTTRNTNLLELNGWVSRQDSDNPNWVAQLRILADIVKQWASRHSVIVIKDYLYDATNPTATTGKVHLADARVVETQHDPNPDIERVRILIPYWWDYRG